MNLPRKHLSFSQINLWLFSKESYRKRYYPAIPPDPITNIYMEFGNKVTKAMENKEEWVAFIPRFETFEYELNIEIEGILIKAFIDNLKEDIVKFKEQKTGMTPWSYVKVEKHLQLDIYSLLLHEKFGKVEDECELVDVRTKKVIEKVMMGNIEMDEGPMSLELTGEYQIITRIITQEDRDDCRKLIVRVGREIEEDYAAMKHLY